MSRSPLAMGSTANMPFPWIFDLRVTILRAMCVRAGDCGKARIVAQGACTCRLCLAKARACAAGGAVDLDGSHPARPGKKTGFRPRESRVRGDAPIVSLHAVDLSRPPDAQ